MAEFERECQDRAIPLWVLPPRSPKLNGNVERTIGTWRCEFYGCRDIPDHLAETNRLVDAFADEFNRVRPHRSLASSSRAFRATSATIIFNIKGLKRFQAGFPPARSGHVIIT